MHTGQTKGTALLVEDEETIRTVSTMILQKSGMAVITADNGVAGVEAFRQHRRAISAVVLDLTMPDMDGVETFREIRRVSADTPVLLSTGYAEEQVRDRFAGEGFAGFIQKPYSADRLLAKIQGVMS